MVHPRVTRALNPQKRKVKFTLKQIRAGFGGKRRQNASKSRKHKHRNPKAKSTSKPKRRVQAKAKNATRTKVVYRTKTKYKTRNVYVEKPKRKVKAKRKRTSNPGPYLLTMAPVLGNPHKRKRRKNTMAKAKRKVSAKRTGTRNPHHKRRSARKHHHRRPRSRNPFGQSTTNIAKTGFGVMIGVSATKMLPRSYPANWTGTLTMSILSTGVTAGALAWLAAKFIKGPIADGVLYGGAAQTLNVIWNAFAPPSIIQYASLGDFAPGGFPLPQGPVRLPLAAAPYEAPNGSRVNVGAFGNAW